MGAIDRRMRREGALLLVVGLAVVSRALGEVQVAVDQALQGNGILDLYEAIVASEGEPAASVSLTSSGEEVGDKSLATDALKGALRDWNEELEPVCAYINPFMSTSFVVCPVMEASVQMMVSSPPDYSSLCTERQAVNPGGELPIPLEDLRGRLPRVIDNGLVQKERKSYYWFFNGITNMYAYVFRYADQTQGKSIADGPQVPDWLRPLAPEGWTSNYVFFERDPLGWRWPIAQTAAKGRHLVFFIRGTIFPGGWLTGMKGRKVQSQGEQAPIIAMLLTDFRINYAPKWETENSKVPGRIHAGFFNFTKEYLTEFRDLLLTKGGGEALVSRFEEITFTGHSLGAAVATISAVFFANRFPELKINAVVFAAPLVGDQEFSDFVSSKVNLRRITYLGAALGTAPGLDSLHPGVGDVVPQVPPSCGGQGIPYCASLDEVLGPPEGLPSYHYAQVKGNIPFYVTDMPADVRSRWLEADRWGMSRSVIMGNVIARHVCSYACWVAEGTGDMDNKCRFPEDPGDVPEQYRCTVKEIQSLTERFPFLKGPAPATGSGSRRLRVDW